MSTGQEPPPGGDENRGSYVVACCWAMIGISCTVLSLRFWGRYLVRQMGWDDWTMLLTLVLFLVYSALITHYAAIGGFRHLFYLTAAEQMEALRYNYLLKPWILMGFAMGKVSVGLLILRIIGRSSTFWRKRLVYFFAGTAFAFNSLNIICQYVQCTPVQALWNHSLVVSGQASCWPPTAVTGFAMFISAWNVVVDVVLALLPITIFYKLNLGWTKKLGLSCLLGLGMVSAICAGIKMQYVLSLNARSDLTWANYNLYLWSAAELFVIIVCGSVPPIKPVWDKFRHPNGSLASRSEYAQKYGSRSYIEMRKQQSQSTDKDVRIHQTTTIDVEKQPDPMHSSFEADSAWTSEPDVHPHARHADMQTGDSQPHRLFPAGDIRIPLR